MEKALIIQLAFLGDVVLITSVIETLHRARPDIEIHVLIKKQYQEVFDCHPYVKKVLVFDHKQQRLKELRRLLNFIRHEHYEYVINAHRFFSSGFLTAFSGASIRSGFNKNPFSFFFTHRAQHEFITGLHEVDRNFRLLSFLNISVVSPPVLYPDASTERSVQQYKQKPYVTISPASVWFTKQYPAEKWIEFIDEIPPDYRVYLTGAGTDYILGELIRCNTKHSDVVNLCGQLTILQTASFMRDAVMNYSNDSAPVHIASAMNAPIVAVFCSTTPDFGFGPLSDRGYVVETDEELLCRPCGIHGRKNCPEKHFRCASGIRKEKLLSFLK